MTRESASPNNIRKSLLSLRPRFHQRLNASWQNVRFKNSSLVLSGLTAQFLLQTWKAQSNMPTWPLKRFMVSRQRRQLGKPPAFSNQELPLKNNTKLSGKHCSQVRQFLKN